MTAFFGGVAAWFGMAVLFLGALCLSGWSYTGHWPAHYAWLVVISIISGISQGIKAFEALKE